MPGRVHADILDRQYRAVMSEFFIADHFSVPLFTNGNIEKGDLIQYPEEAVIKRRSECFDLGQIRPRNIPALSITLVNALSFGVAAGLPLNRIVELEGAIGGSIALINSITIDPASRDHTEHEPSETSVRDLPECEVVRLAVRGWESLYIVASDVIRGQVTASSIVSFVGGVAVDASIVEQRVRQLIGAVPHISVQVQGGAVAMRSLRTPDVQSIAVKSRFVSPLHLARLYELYRAAGPNDLEIRVRRLLRDQPPGAFEEGRAALLDWLEQVGLVEKNKHLFYNRVFFWESRQILDEATAAAIPREHWRALGIISAAHELAVW